MAQHDVTFFVPKRPLEYADIEFDVAADGDALGSLHISKGAIVWKPKGKSYGYRLNWKQLDAMFQERGTKRKP